MADALVPKAYLSCIALGQQQTTLHPTADFSLKLSRVGSWMGERLLLEVELVGPFSGLKKYPNAPGQ
jgi:hypothetical protein